MSSPYLPQLIQIAQQELPGIQYDLTNASTLYTLQAAAQRMHNVLAYLTHHCIMASYPGGVPVVAPVAQVVAPVAPPQQSVGHPPAATYFPQLGQPLAPTPQLPGFGVPQQAVQPSHVAEVVLTPQGTRVIPPGGVGPVSVLPPGSHADATFGQAQPAMAPFHQQPQPVAGDVVLPQGGAMTPEVAAALGAAGARNITAEQPR